MRLLTESCHAQLVHWPKAGRHVLAQFDDETIVVYQAFRLSIGNFAARHGFFGGEFSFSRMSWIKPSCLWMMYRCGWGQKSDQEIVLAVWLKRSAFDSILAQAVHSSFVPEIYGSEPEWKAALERSSVQLQWDPDHNPSGARVERRAIQLGLRGEVLARYAKEWAVHIEDVSGFVHEQYEHVTKHEYEELVTPHERVYPVADARVAARLGISEGDED
ncbi:MAG TPA: DUF4291 domain-containing protein [Anaerolineales bacterium]|nr:DUF4291 domain-containing protein [Anaerolineales bacterium]